MKIAIIGSGNVGGALGEKLAAAGHTIYFGVRDLSNFKGKDMVNGDSITSHLIADAVKMADTIIIAVPFSEVANAAKELGDVSGKVLIDTTNIIGDKLEGFPDGFEALLSLTKGTEIAKGFNSTSWENMRNPVIDGIKIDMFTAGDSQKAKDVVTQLAQDIGFGHVYDFGGNDKVMLLEQFALAWINLAFFQKVGRRMAFHVIKE